MNKKEFIEELSKRTGYTIDKCEIINNILEDNSLIGRKNKEKIINTLKEKLNIADTEADNIYNTLSDILKEGIKDKLKHPFKDLDK